jgi:subtilisin family serine protease
MSKKTVAAILGTLLTGAAVVAPGTASGAEGSLDAVEAPRVSERGDTARYVLVRDTASAGGLNLPKAADDVERLSAVGAVVADLTAAQAANLDSAPGVTVSPDVKIGRVADPAVEPRALKRDGTPLTSLRPQLAATTAARSWGLDRLDQRSLPLSRTYTTRRGARGQGVHVYVIDDGIAAGHPEFRGRVGRGIDYVDNDNNPQQCGNTPHGTHVAGTIGSTKFGVAPQVTLHGVRVLDCAGGGYASDLLAAMNWVAQQRQKVGRTVIANMSLGGPRNGAVNAATANMVRHGVVTATAAGNEADNSYYHSPASTPEAITVAASRSGDYDAPYSNYGRVIDLYAPGSAIWSTYAYNPANKLRLSGTSMAAPHVAGWAALYLGLHPNAAPAKVRQALIESGTKRKITGEVGGTPDVLPYMKHL